MTSLDKGFGKVLISNDNKTMAVWMNNDPFIVGILDAGILVRVENSTPSEWQEGTLDRIKEHFGLSILEGGPNDDPFDGCDGITFHKVMWLPNATMMGFELAESIYDEGEYEFYHRGTDNARRMVSEEDYHRYCLYAQPQVLL